MFVHRPDHSGRGQQPEGRSLEVIHLENEYVHIDDNINIKKTRKRMIYWLKLDGVGPVDNRPSPD